MKQRTQVDALKVGNHVYHAQAGQRDANHDRAGGVGHCLAHRQQPGQPVAAPVGLLQIGQAPGQHDRQQGVAHNELVLRVAGEEGKTKRILLAGEHEGHQDVQQHRGQGLIALAEQPQGQGVHRQHVQQGQQGAQQPEGLLRRQAGKLRK